MLTLIYILGVLAVYFYFFVIVGGFDVAVGWFGIFWPVMLVLWCLYKLRRLFNPEAPDFWSLFDGC